MNPLRLPRPALLSCLGLLLALSPAIRAAEAESPVFRSVLIDGQAPLFSLADATGSGRWVKIGESFDGWKLQSFDAAKQTLTVIHDGKTSELSLESGQLKDDAAANNKGTVAEADALLQKMRFEEMISKTLSAQQSAMAKSMGGMLGKDVPEDQRARMVEFQKKIMATMFEEMDLPGMRQDLASVYAETFSSAELKAQSDFYTTPAGQAMLDKQPVIQERITALMMPRMMKAMPKVQAMTRQFAEEEKAAKSAAKAAEKTAP